MNIWTKHSIDYANQKNYLDELFKVYPTIPDGIRDVNTFAWVNIKDAFDKQDNDSLIKALLKLNLFPIKDSYVAYLKQDSSAIDRNPETINRICGRLYEMGIEKIIEKCSEPKETNRQIGPMFGNWLNKKHIGIEPVDLTTFLSDNKNAILGGSYKEKIKFAKSHLNYNRNKGLDLVARFNGKYVIGEAKFLSSNIEKQNKHVLTGLKKDYKNIVNINIVDGIPNQKSFLNFYNKVSLLNAEKNVLSVLVLRDFLYQI